MISVRSNIVEFAALLVHETKRAVLLDHGADKPVWLPKSLVEDNGDGTWGPPEGVLIDKGVI